MITVDELVTTATERTGLSDFGADTWQEGLGVLVDALNTEAGLNELGVAAMTDQIVGNLVNRLRVEQCYAEHPEIDDEQIVAPLFGLGLPRTGSTALSFLLAQDPTRRSLRVWEAAQPCPPPETATEHTDARIADAAAGIEMTNAMFPGFEGMLPTAADGPQECIVVMASDFRSLIFEGMAFVPSYTEWLLACDMTPAYRYHQRVLKLLQWRCPPTRWWLKSPAHMLSIDALDAVYPDARFVMTHRAVGDVLPSLCALYAALGGVLAQRLDMPAVGAHNTMVWRTALARLLAFRDDGREARFFDLWFADVQRAPIAQVESLYARLGDELSDEARTRMTAWWERHATQPSATRHAPEEYGLDAATLDDAFAFYNNRFGSSHG